VRPIVGNAACDKTQDPKLCITSRRLARPVGTMWIATLCNSSLAYRHLESKLAMGRVTCVNAADPIISTTCNNDQLKATNS
jgi:hypothetical protein